MEKYLKIGDYFGGDVTVSSGTRERIVSAKGEVVATTPSPQVARLAVHAINSHDELVAMNKELLAALEGVIDYLTFEGFGGTYIGIREDFDITEGMKPFLDVITKAKAAS